MNRKTKILIAAGLIASVGALTAAGASYAEYGRGGHDCHGEQGAGFHGKGGKHGRHAMRLLERFDTDKDGGVTQAEIDQTRGGQFTAFDSDGDGQLSLKEYEALWLDVMRERMVDRFQNLDEDGDATVTSAEFSEPFGQMVQRMDRNGDGKLTKEDRKRRHHKHDDDDDDHDDDDEHDDD